jgi:hypothetical protein
MAHNSREISTTIVSFDEENGQQREFRSRRDYQLLDTSQSLVIRDKGKLCIQSFVEWQVQQFRFQKRFTHKLTGSVEVRSARLLHFAQFSCSSYISARM